MKKARSIWTVYDLFNEEVVASYTTDIQAITCAMGVIQDIIDCDEVYDSHAVVADCEYNADGQVTKAKYKYTHEDGEDVIYVSIESNTLIGGY